MRHRNSRETARDWIGVVADNKRQGSARGSGRAGEERRADELRRIPGDIGEVVDKKKQRWWRNREKGSIGIAVVDC